MHGAARQRVLDRDVEAAGVVVEVLKRRRRGFEEPRQDRGELLLVARLQRRLVAVRIVAAAGRGGADEVGRIVDGLREGGEGEGVGGDGGERPRPGGDVLGVCGVVGACAVLERVGRVAAVEDCERGGEAFIGI